jgi:sulfatase maturation enzyme AslB (radical SAM superfamily)
MNVKDFVLHPTLCSLPWIGVHVTPNGTIKNCAISGEVLGNLHTNTLEDCLHGSVNQQIKKDMIAKIAHERCNSCYSVENLSNNKAFNESNRSWYKKYGVKSTDLSMYDDPTKFSLRILDLRWKNTCNQACVYCGPDLSSKWAQELNDYRWSVDDQVLEKNKKYIFDQLTHINHVYLAGGEPLLMKENQELLNKLFDINPNVEIRVNTNLSLLDTPVFTILEKFNNVKWTISVDSIESSYEYIRWPGKWSTFSENLNILYQKNKNINFNMVWCALNSTKIFDCIDYLNNNGFHENMYIIQCLTDPGPLDLRNLPDAQLTELKQIILSRIETADSSQWFAKCLHSMYNFLNQPFSPNINNLKTFLSTIDQRRQLDSQTLFPHIYDPN